MTKEEVIEKGIAQIEVYLGNFANRLYFDLKNDPTEFEGAMPDDIYALFVESLN